jgi:hypothetical protein
MFLRYELFVSGIESDGLRVMFAREKVRRGKKRQEEVMM